MLEAVTGALDGLPAWQATIVVIGASLLGAVLLEMVVLRTIRRLAGRTETSLDDILFTELRVPLVVTAALAGVFVLSRTPAVATTLLDRALFDQFLGRPALSVILVTWAWALNRIVARLLDEPDGSGPRYEIAPVVSNVWTIFVFVGTIGLLLSIWRIEITPLLGAAGVAGIAIGFAAKDTVANFFGGLALFFDDTYKLGDFVELESGESGTVVKIGIRSTTLLTRSEVLVTVPNSMLNAGKVVNQSAPQRRKRIKLPVGVAYGTDLDTVESILLEVAEAEKNVLGTPEPRVRFRAFGDSALEYELLAWVASPTADGRTRHALNRAIYTAFEDAGIVIPFPQRDVSLRSASAIDDAPLVSHERAPE